MTVWTPAYQRRLWLGHAVVELRHLLGVAGLTLPARVLVTTGPTMLVHGHPAAGQCDRSGARADGLSVITINPSESGATRVLEILIHELIHAADNCCSQHGDWFQAWAAHLGLTWPTGFPAYTSAGPHLRRQLDEFAKGLGLYPSETVGFNLTGSGMVAA